MPCLQCDPIHSLTAYTVYIQHISFNILYAKCIFKQRWKVNYSPNNFNKRYSHTPTSCQQLCYEFQSLKSTYCSCIKTSFAIIYLFFIFIQMSLFECKPIFWMSQTKKCNYPLIIVDETLVHESVGWRHQRNYNLPPQDSAPTLCVPSSPLFSIHPPLH